MHSQVATDYSMTASPGRVLPVAERAAGCYIEAEGRRYLDACGGAMVLLLGHSHPRIVEALERQARELAFTYRFSFRNRPMLELAQRVARLAPGELEWCFFNSSGSESNESAVHLAVLYWELRGKPGKIEFLSRVTSFHGSTLGALSLSGSRWRAPFELMLKKYAVVPNADTAEEGAAALEAAIQSRGPDHVAAFVIEPITGSSGAAVELPEGYLPAVREICDRYDVLLIADEVITAFGRTGRWFGSEHFGAVPDVITFGKAIGGGVVPLSGLVAARRIREVIETSPSGFSYGHTFSGYPTGCAVGCAVIDVIEQEGLVEQAAQKGARIRADLEKLQARHPLMYALRGRGLLQGIELRDPAGARFPATRGISGALTRAAQNRDLMIYACPTPVGNQHMDAVLIAPPMIIGDAEIQELFEKLDVALEDVEKTL
ncbi:MAG: aminotransferase class III-fold pyridoxal phosphate-dependent enzyme [Myxococcales bacterium]|nr:aminotransferase class III-fold pyridoxal phosphate-dependent enzyme [Myxococcales bacterium]MDH5305821.1 aminotransferase class III-fold pyridoxal phosphate-dependent enzyme [Myxococcales bacterium]MDH5565794.1 aminotransferase class III-fold pyridoxal phosphate-dependent enzyme [Myxococcales bacterium]